MRQVAADILPGRLQMRGRRWSVEQECGEGSCKQITIDGMGVQQDHCLRFFKRGLCAGVVWLGGSGYKWFL